MAEGYFSRAKRPFQIAAEQVRYLAYELADRATDHLPNRESFHTLGNILLEIQ